MTITPEELAAMVQLLADQIEQDSPKTVTTIDAITYELARLRQDLVTRNVRDQAEAMARLQERYAAEDANQ